MPAGAATDYSSVTMILFGNFNLGVAFGYGSEMSMIVDPYTRKNFNQLEVTSQERVDIVAHGVNRSTTVAGPIVALHGAA
jgi:hypothetical protein